MKKIVCNMCGKAFDTWDLQEGFGFHSLYIGYGSKYDENSLDLDLCCECMDKIIDACMISPVNDPA